MPTPGIRCSSVLSNYFFFFPHTNAVCSVLPVETFLLGEEGGSRRRAFPAAGRRAFALLPSPPGGRRLGFLYLALLRAVFPSCSELLFGFAGKKKSSCATIYFSYSF